MANKIIKQMLEKKAQSNMFWIIIGAVLALVVMIIMLLLFTSKSNILEDGVSGCEGKGGTCRASCESDELASPFECSSPSEKCCIGFGSSNDEG